MIMALVLGIFTYIYIFPVSHFLVHVTEPNWYCEARHSPCVPSPMPRLLTTSTHTSVPFRDPSSNARRSTTQNAPVQTHKGQVWFLSMQLMRPTR